MESHVAGVIELDDASHNKEKHINRDAYVEQASGAHRPLIRIKTQCFYEPLEIASLLSKKFKIPVSKIHGYENVTL